MFDFYVNFPEHFFTYTNNCVILLVGEKLKEKQNIIMIFIECFAE